MSREPFMKTLKVMKKIYGAILSFLMTVSVAGCMFEVLEEPVESPVSVELTAMMEAGPDSRTGLSGLEGGMYYPLWSAEDEIAVFADNDKTPSKFTLTSGEGETKASFSGTRSGSSYIALYPYGEDVTVSDGVLSLTLPQTQKYATGSFGQSAYPMLGRGGSDGVLDFTNLCAVLKISFEGTAAIRSVTLTANDEKTFLSGPAAVALNGTESVAGPLEMSEGGSGSVVLDCMGLEISEDSPADVFIAIPAQTYKGGLTIEVDTYTDKVTRVVKSDLVFARSQIRTIPRFSLMSDMGDPALQLEKERDALIAIYKALGGDNWTNTDNWCSDKPFEQWYGVTTDASGSVISLQLHNNNLVGSLPDELGDLRSIESISVINNSITSLPDLSSCVDLVDLSFSGNGMTGDFPDWIFRHDNLKYSWCHNLKGNYLDVSNSNIPAPEFDMQSFEGVRVVAKDVYESNKLTILYEWATLSAGQIVFTDDYMSDVMSVYEKFKDDGLEIIGICGAPERNAEEIIYEYGMEWNNIVYSKSNPWVHYQVNQYQYYTYPDNVIPNIVIVDSNGYVVWSLEISDIPLSRFCTYYFRDQDADYYTSTDYSADGRVTTLQTATRGNGIDILLMGDAYSDRLIADGTYAEDMKAMMEAFFSEEPYKSHRDHFNVYSVDVVSENEVYDTYSLTALEGWFGEGTAVGGNDYTCAEYGLEAISEERLEDALIIIAMNSEAYAGTCYMYYPSDGDYGNGVSMAYFPVGSDPDQLAQLVHHEAGGHGFAKLADEYAYKSMGRIPQEAIEDYEYLENYGWWKNVDFTDDESLVKWSCFLSDSRYGNEGLGVYEGACTYWIGAYRPTDNSIMRYNYGGFNAPSREAIYYRIHKLAYGDSWEYDYEDFVEYDAVNRSATASRASRSNYVERALEPTSPPVVVGKSWRVAEQKPTHKGYER